ncbi:MAG TPA: hypothetical protein VG496_15730 [Myxococcales bacterium]|nr:hypothetical protein [Myxococcales bacterium]
MPACPVCETENPGNAVECMKCGKVLRNAADVPGFAPAIEGLEHTLREPARVDVEPLSGLEPTQVAAPGLRVAGEQLLVERTPHESNGAPVNWVPGQLEIEHGRELGAPRRPPAPAEGEAARTSDIVLCPACLARVPAGLRCVECGVPLPARDR